MIEFTSLPRECDLSAGEDYRGIAGQVFSNMELTIIEAAFEPKRFWKIDQAAHDRGWAANPQEYEQRVVAFWRQTLGVPAESLVTIPESDVREER